MARVTIVGAGQLGSRHLQALQAVRQPLEIHVVDPSPQALKVAEERFLEAASGIRHQVHFGGAFEPTGPIDVAIVATTSAVRRAATERLLRASPVRYLVLEKLLFDRPGDRGAFEKLLADRVTAWVNCPMRMMPAYETIRVEIGTGPVDYRVSGSRYGLVTNAIHYVDHVAHLSGCTDFSLDTRDVDAVPVPSKRPGFLELNGRLVARFADGSRCEVVCYPEGDAPTLVEIFTSARRYIVRESAGRLWAASSLDQWEWEERDARIPYQSEMTTQVVESLLETGTCPLSPLADSLRLHVSLLDPLLELLRARQPGRDHYPFT